MEKVKNDKLNVFLFIACYSGEPKAGEAYIAVTKATLYEEVAVELENLGNQAVIFTTTKPLLDIKRSLRFHKTPYLLVDIGASYDLEMISGFLPESKIELFKRITQNEFSKEKTHLKRILNDAVTNENYEVAAPVKKLTQPSK